MIGIIGFGHGTETTELRLKVIFYRWYAGFVILLTNGAKTAMIKLGIITHAIK